MHDYEDLLQNENVIPRPQPEESAFRLVEKQIPRSARNDSCTQLTRATEYILQLDLELRS